MLHQLLLHKKCASSWMTMFGRSITPDPQRFVVADSDSDSKSFCIYVVFSLAFKCTEYTRIKQSGVVHQEYVYIS